ncbi:hypothetical protein MMC17_000795 [Xylographa soralifera]|nr:hypothetical protein [Xylographa soralifera]
MAISDKERLEKLERDAVKLMHLEQRIQNLEGSFKQMKSKLAESEPLEQIATAMRMHFFETYKRDAGHEYTEIREPFLEDEVATALQGMVATDVLLYLDGERTDSLVFAEIYGISLHEYAILKHVHGIEEIIDRFGTLRARDPAQPLPSSLVYAYLAIVDKCISELDSKPPWEVRLSLTDPAYELFGLKKVFLQLAAKARPRPWHLVS